LKKENKKNDLFPTRRLAVKQKDWPDTIVIEHDIGPMIRETFSLDKKKPDKPAEVIPLKPKK